MVRRRREIVWISDLCNIRSKDRRCTDRLLLSVSCSSSSSCEQATISNDRRSTTIPFKQHNDYSHLVVEDSALSRGGRWDEVLVQYFENVLTDLGELGFNLLSVLLDHGDLALVSL